MESPELLLTILLLGTGTVLNMAVLAYFAARALRATRPQGRRPRTLHGRVLTTVPR